MAISQASTHAIWLHRLLTNLNCPQSAPTIIHSNNQSATQLTQNPRFHAHSKHIAIQIHFVKQQVAAGEVQMK